MLTMSSAALSHVGRVRETNEDSLVVTGRIVAVADGLGGHVAGEVASKIAVERLAELADLAEPTERDLREAIADANRRILTDAEVHAENTGMGTTLCGLALVAVDGEQRCIVFNIGDSRVYRYLDGRLEPVTTDHSEVAEMVAAGYLSREQAARHPRRNVITRCLGTTPAPEPDLFVVDATEPARYLVCSDGLTGEVDEGEIADLLAGTTGGHDAVEALVSAALAAGGRDNVTIIVVDLDPVSRQPETATSDIEAQASS